MKIGFIGLGIMGESMCENIVKKHNDDVYVCDLVPAQVEKLVAVGAIACKDAVEVIEKADTIFSMMPTSEHTKAVYQNALSVLKEGKICVDMATIEPSASVEVAKIVKETGAQFMDAPVLKSKSAAIAGDLGIVVGGDKEIYDIIEPILAYMGSTLHYMGDNGKGLVAKICANTMLGGVQNAVNETLILAQANGLSLDNYVKAMALSTGSNAYLPAKLEALRNADYTTAFSVENMNKDLHICEELAKESNVSMPGLENDLGVYAWLMANGYAKQDYSASIEAIRNGRK